MKTLVCLSDITGNSYAYLPSWPLTVLQLKDTHPFDTTGVDNFRPLFVKKVFCEKNYDKMSKTWVTLYMCASTRVILLDLVLQPNSTSDCMLLSCHIGISEWIYTL